MLTVARHPLPGTARPPPSPPFQPNSSKKKKFYLVLFAGQPDQRMALPTPLGLEDAQTDRAPSKAAFEQKRERNNARKKGGKKAATGKVDIEWIMKKKELYRSRGKEGVPRDSKYTARSRKARF